MSEFEIVLELPQPPIVGKCARCRVTDKDVESGNVVVSPRGVAHYGQDYGMTACGRDATGDKWWWPL